MQAEQGNQFIREWSMLVLVQKTAGRELHACVSK